MSLYLIRGGIYRNCCFEFYGSHNRIKFGNNCSARNGSFYIEDSNNSIITGNRTNYAGKIHIACTESQTILIGDECLFSSEIVIRSGDSHSIINSNGNRINYAMNVKIGNHVWVGYRVLINKGVCIPDNCVIGTGAVLTKPYTERNTVIAGVPAKVVKREINWMTKRV